MASEASFGVALYMRPFYPSDIHLESGDNNTIILHAKHDEHVDQHGIVKRELIREYQLPEGISINRLESEFTRSGILIIRAVKDAQKAASAESSELKVKPAEKEEAPEEIECAGSSKTIRGIEIRDVNEKSESSQEAELSLDEKLKEAKQMAFNLGRELCSDEVKGETEVVPSLQSGLAEGMEIIEAAPSPQSSSTEIMDVKEMSETTPSPQSSSTEIMGDGIEGINSPPVPEMMEARETTLSPRPTSTDIMEATDPPSSPSEIMEATETAQSPQSSSTEIMEAADTAQSPQSSSTEIMEAAETAQSPPSSSVEAMETSKESP